MTKTGIGQQQYFTTSDFRWQVTLSIHRINTRVSVHLRVQSRPGGDRSPTVCRGFTRRLLESDKRCDRRTKLIIHLRLLSSSKLIAAVLRSSHHPCHYLSAVFVASFPWERLLARWWKPNTRTPPTQPAPEAKYPRITTWPQYFFRSVFVCLFWVVAAVVVVVVAAAAVLAELLVGG